MKNGLFIVRGLFAGSLAAVRGIFIENKRSRAVMELLLLLLALYLLFGLGTYVEVLRGHTNYMSFWHAPWQWIFSHCIRR